MIANQLPLPRQVDIVFQQIFDELLHLSSGIVFLHIRNNIVGKFGIRHEPIDSKNGFVKPSRGLTEHEIHAFRKMAIQSLQHKGNWTHGEILFEFAVKNDILVSSVQFESSYNMANILIKSRQRT